MTDKFAKVFAKVIVIGQVIAIGLTFFREPFNYGQTIHTIGLALFTLCALIAIVYCLTIRDIGSKKRMLLLFTTIPVFVGLLFEANHWPGAAVIALTMVIPIIAYLFLVLTNRKQYKNELGFLTIIVADGIVRLSILVESWIR